MIRSHGFVAPETIEPEEYVRLGGTSELSEEIINPDGDWRPYLPAYEPQYNDTFDSYGCTVFGTQNAYESDFKRMTGKDHNFAERFNYIMANIRPPGADPHQVAESIREHKMIPQEMLPMTGTFDEFCRPDPMPARYLVEGQRLPWELKHEWGWRRAPSIETRIKLLKEELRRGTVCISVTAWHLQNGLYVDRGHPNTHWCQLAYIDHVNGKDYPIVNDSYGTEEEAMKVLASDHDIRFAKRYNVVEQGEVSFDGPWAWLKEWWYEFIR